MSEIKLQNNSASSINKYGSVQLQSTAKLGAHTIALTGNPPLNLAKIPLRPVPYQGFKTATRISRATTGLGQNIGETLSALSKPSTYTDIHLVASTLKTVQYFLDKQVKLGVLSNADMDDKFLAAFAPGIQKMDNDGLNTTYQALSSPAMEDFKSGLLKEIARGKLPADKITELKDMYSNICNLEALVVQEISIRVNVASMSPQQASEYESLTERHQDVGQGAADVSSPLVPQQSTSAPDASGMSISNLALMVGKEAGDAVKEAKIANQSQQIMQKHNIDPLAPKKFGDMLRQTELTMNFSLPFLLGYAEGQKEGEAPITDPHFQFKNAFQVNNGKKDLDVEQQQYLSFRNKVETTLFNELDEKNTSGDDRPVFAALNITQTEEGAASHYGGAVIVFKPEVKRKATYTLNDSFKTLPLKVTEEKITAFLDDLAEHYVSNEAIKLQLQQKEPPSALRNELAKTLRAVKDAPLPTMLNADPVADFLTQPMNKINIPKWLSTELIVKAFTDKDRLDNSTATFDHIENLMAEMTEVGTEYFARAGIDHFLNPKEGVSNFGGSFYFEAQLHGNVNLGTDVQEIRLGKYQFEEQVQVHVEKNLQDYAEAKQELRRTNPQMSEEELKTTLVNQEIDKKKAELEQKLKNMGIKLAFYDESKVGDSDVASSHTNQIKEKIAESVVPELQNLLDGLKTPEKQAEFCHSLVERNSHIKGELVRKWGQDLENIPKKFWDYLSQPIKEIDERGSIKNGGILYSNQLMEKIFAESDKRLEQLNAFTSKYDEMISDRRLAFETEDAKQEFIDFALSQDWLSSIPIIHMEDAVKFLKEAFDMRKLAMEDCGKLLTDKVLPQIQGYDGGCQEILGGKSIVGGAAGKALSKACLQAIDDALKTCKENLSSGIKNTLAEKLQKEPSIKKSLERKVSLLKELEGYQFSSVQDRDAFVGWILNSRAIKSPVEMKLIFDTSNTMMKSLKQFKATNRPLDARGYLAIYSSFYNTLIQSTDDIKKVHDELGPDDTQANIDRSVSVAFSRLLATGDFGSADEIDAMLNTDAIRHFRSTIPSLYESAVEINEKDDPDLLNEADCAFHMNTFGEAIDRSLSWLRPDAAKLSLNYEEVPFEAINSRDRQMLAVMMPGLINVLETRKPYNPGSLHTAQSIAPPAHPELLPKTLQEREQFLLSVLPTYHNFEKTNDYGSNFHGRTHATRAFVLANVMGNILREKGIQVDMNALSLGIAGHDMGRQRNGKDTFEKESATATLNKIHELYPGAGGDAWDEGIAQGINNVLSKTIEGYLLNCADSLDYERISPIDEKYFPFLQIPLETKEGYHPVDTKLRAELIKESKLLTQLTDPRTANEGHYRELLEQLNNEQLTEDEHDAIMDEMNEIQAQNQQAEKEQTDTLTDEAIILLVKNAITSNPDKFPLFSKYYK